MEKKDDNLTINNISHYISDKRMEHVICLNSVDSTNLVLKELAENGAESGKTVIANKQTKGKGRLGRKFESPEDKGIYLSYLMKLNCEPKESVTLTAWTAIAVSNAVFKVTGIRPKIKWVNDLIINNKKIGGILSEMATENNNKSIKYIIVGIGINVHEKATDFPEQLQSIASSISAETGKSFSRAQIAAEIINEMDRISENWPAAKQEYLDSYRENCVTLGKEVRIISSNDEKCGVATKINEDFSLEISYADGKQETVSTGEVSIRGMYDYI